MTDHKDHSLDHFPQNCIISRTPHSSKSARPRQAHMAIDGCSEGSNPVETVRLRASSHANLP
eukprot:2626908-Amphidinium_carterae.1